MFKPHIVIVGGGFGGLSAAKVLGYSKQVRITLIDKRNHHLFQPLLYQVSMAGLSPADIATPIRGVLSRFQNCNVLLGTATGVDVKRRVLQTDFGDLAFDYLVLACGAQHSYFGHDEWEQFAPGLKTLEQATEIRRRVLTAFELAEREHDAEKQRQLLTFIVIGGGPTGVELAGALGEISRYTLAKDFRQIDPKRTRVILIEAGPRILPSFHVELAQRAVRDLENLGVHVWSSSRVTAVNRDGVAMNEEFVKAATVIWAAGVAPASINKSLQLPLDRLGRLLVASDCSLPEAPNIFVIGDQAHYEIAEGQALPGLAPVAMQQGRYVARVILGELNKQARPQFQFVDKGTMATIGRRRAVMEYKSLRAVGVIAWYAWLFVHIFYLIGFKNRVVVLMQWVWSYFTFKRGARLITDRNWQIK